MPDALAVLRLSDGRRGHDNQSLGLIEALARLRPVVTEEVAVSRGLRGAWLASRATAAARGARLVVAAGHGTHLALLVAARRTGARSVVLMKPSLPRSLFDLCIVPRHDGVPAGANVLHTLGVLNRVRPGGPRDPHHALILLGGPSRHHGWDPARLRRQIAELAGDDDTVRWQVATSPRTPGTTLDALAGIPRLNPVPFAETSPGWLPEQLARASRVWVTEDSVSMAYEAASSGAGTGILPVPARGRPGRVHRAVNALLDSGHAVPFDDRQRWHGRREPPPLQEAARCARALLDRWPDLA